MNVKVGQVWKDNYDTGTDYHREVTIVAIDGDRVRIQHAARKTWTSIKRFNGKSNGFSLVRDIA